MNDDVGVVHHNRVPPWQLNAFVPVIAFNCVLELCLKNTTKTHTESQKEETTSSHMLIRQIKFSNVLELVSTHCAFHQSTQYHMVRFDV